MSVGQLTIGRLAKAANVGIETVRYYQRRKLLPVPSANGTFRHYDPALADRIRFVKRAQELGFSLDEIGYCCGCRMAPTVGRSAAFRGSAWRRSKPSWPI